MDMEISSISNYSVAKSEEGT